jgi:hypothetical protein
LITLTSKQIDDLCKTIVDDYNNRIYSVDYINEILAAFDEELSCFTSRNKYNLLSLSGYEHCPTFDLVINEKLVIIPYKEDVFSISSIFLDKGKTIYLPDMPSEAREKISSKYLHYITRLEDKIGVPFYEILKME